jgi:predicted dehydrogenase
MRITVVGYGSIGRRHARIACELGHEVTVVTKQSIVEFQSRQNLKQALRDFAPESFVIANPTSSHANALAELQAIQFEGPILVEKPLAIRSSELNSLSRTAKTFVAYNLRFHPVIQAIKEKIGVRSVISAQLYVGQDLKTWRPDRDYSKSYSASKDQGGGVLRDLSHELDLILHLLGPVKRVAAVGGKRSSLNISSEDCVSALMETESGSMVTLELNYLHQKSCRVLNLNADGLTVRGDLIAGTLVTNGEPETFEMNSDLTYRRQLEDFLDGGRQVCTYTMGLASVKLIEAIETAMESEKWIRP